jgi:flagellar protein FliO/FliZ
MSGSGSVEAAAAVALTPAPLPQAGEGLRSGSDIVIGTTVNTVEAAAPAPAPAPAAEGQGEGTGEAVASNPAEPQAAPTAAQVLKKPATAHTATVGHPTKPQAFAKPADGPGVGGAVFALILVVSLILGLGWLAKRMPGFGRVAGGNGLRVVGSLSLGPRDRVVVVDVGGTQLLLGVGQNGMTTLHTLSEPLPVAQPSQGTPSLQNLATPFAQLLAKHLGKKP